MKPPKIQAYKPGDKVSTGHTLKRRLKKSPHPSCEVNDTDCRAWEYEGGGWDYEYSFRWPAVTS